MTPAPDETLYHECVAQWDLLYARVKTRITLPGHHGWDDLREMTIYKAFSHGHMWNAAKGPRPRWIERVMTHHVRCALRAR